jgi:hypothetical protein
MEDDKEIKLVELIIDEEEDIFGIQAISLVQFPAIEENFVYFQKSKSMTLAKVDEEKQILVGPALIPDKKIPRFDEEKNEEYEVYFTKDTVKRASELFMEKNKTNEHTYEHKLPVENVSVVESWTISDRINDKSRLFGFNLPIGTWMVSVKVNNQEMWEKIKNKSIRGFSIEGYFVDKLVEMQNLSVKCDDCPDAKCGDCRETNGKSILSQKIKNDILNILLEEELKPVGLLNDKPLFKTQAEAEIFSHLEYGEKMVSSFNLNGEILYYPQNAG